MTAFAFDTLESVEILKEAGMLEKQAKAITTVIQKSQEVAAPMIEASCQEYTSALKNDFQKLEHRFEKLEHNMRHEMGDLRKDTQHSIKEFESRMQHSTKELESRMTIKLGSIVAAGLGLIVLLAKFLSIT